MSNTKERPILFSGPMVRAILGGHKTQTRRVIRLPLGYEHNEVYGYEGVYGGLHALACDPGPSRAIRCPHGEPKDLLWVREAHGIATGHMYDGAAAVRYFADGSIRSVADERSNASRRSLSMSKSRPSIHMPRWASRILLEVTDVRVERLQSISEEDARAEGVQALDSYMGEPGWYAADASNPHATVSRAAVNAFACLWDKTGDGRHTWASDPWVWVVSFKVVEVS